MRLLNKKEISDIKITTAKQNEAMVLAANSKMKEFQDKIAKINSILEQKQKETAIFITNAENTKQALLNEMASLENRRQQLLAPITTELAILEAKKLENSILLEDIKSNMAELNEGRKNIESKWAELDHRTAKVEQREQNLDKYAKTIETSAESLKQTEIDLNNRQEEVENYATVENTILDIKRKEINEDLAYISKIRVILDEQRLDLEKRETKLADRQAVLKHTVDRLKSQGINI